MEGAHTATPLHALDVQTQFSLLVWPMPCVPEPTELARFPPLLPFRFSPLHHVVGAQHPPGIVHLYRPQQRLGQYWGHG